MAIGIGRRQFVAALGSASLAWPFAARAQQPAMPVIGILSSLSSGYIAGRMVSVRQGLSEAGYTEGQNVATEYRLAESQPGRLPAFAAGGTDPAKAAKAATATIPIVFVSAADPVKAGIVTSLNQPGGNVTGVSILGSVVEAKRVGLLNEIIPGTTPIGVLLNPTYPDADVELKQAQDAARAINRQLIIVRATTDAEIDAAFATFAQQGAGALLVTADVLFASRREQLVALAARFKLPAIYSQREFTETGGLISYAPDYVAGYRQAGNYIGQVLKGAKPTELPIMQSTKFELIVNLKTAKAFGIVLPPTLLATADDVIE
jgi:putative tryptophan/tyrosine transport system substrate-binding protein